MEMGFELITWNTIFKYCHEDQCEWNLFYLMQNLFLRQFFSWQSFKIIDIQKVTSCFGDIQEFDSDAEHLLFIQFEWNLVRIYLKWFPVKLWLPVFSFCYIFQIKKMVKKFTVFFIYIYIYINHNVKKT